MTPAIEDTAVRATPAGARQPGAGLETNVIHTGDALDLLRTLPDNAVDCVVTSPPYNLMNRGAKPSGMFKALKWVEEFHDAGYADYQDALPEADYQEWLRAVVAECLRVSRGLVWVNHKTRYRDGVGIHPLSFLPFPMYTEIVWDRGISMTFNSRRFAPSHEYFFGFGTPHFWDSTLNKKLSVWRVVPFNQAGGHPCPYPERLIRPLIEASCPVDGIVLDPFMGSGTTAIVARDSGRNYIGIEMAEEYVAMAERRLSHGYTLPMLFADASTEAG